jgi:hypothetical protein
MERSASDTSESSLASATRARPEDSGRQEARARILSQSSHVAQFNTTQFRTDRLRHSPNSWRSRLSQVVANRQPIEPLFYPPERTVFGRRRVPITSNQSRRCCFYVTQLPLFLSKHKSRTLRHRNTTPRSIPSPDLGGITKPRVSRTSRCLRPVLLQNLCFPAFRLT